MVNEAEVKVKSLQKALEILNCFTKKSSCGVTEISEQLDLNKSNVHNILTTFKAMGYLDQDDESGRYKLGLSVYSLCYSLGQNLSIGSVAAPYLQELADMAGERVYLAIPHEQEIIYVTSAYPKTSIDLMRPIMGEHAQMHCTGLGKAMLAYLPDEKQRAYAARKLEAYTDYTITDGDALLKELREIRQRGYAIDNMEHEFGVKCVAVPVLGRNGQVVAGVSISGPSLRFYDERIQSLAKELQNKIRELQNILY